MRCQVGLSAVSDAENAVRGFPRGWFIDAFGNIPCTASIDGGSIDNQCIGQLGLQLLKFLGADTRHLNVEFH